MFDDLVIRLIVTTIIAILPIYGMYRTLKLLTDDVFDYVGEVNGKREIEKIKILIKLSELENKHKEIKEEVEKIKELREIVSNNTNHILEMVCILEKEIKNKHE